MDFFSNIFSGDGFPSRWNCGEAWQAEPWWGWLHICCDVLIFAAYFAIPLTLIRFIRKRNDLPFLGLVYLFAGFIVACGLTHLMEALIFYWPAYRLSGLLKLATAAVSILTVVRIQGIMPQALALRSPAESSREVDAKTAELRELTEKLRLEVENSRRMNNELRDHREMLRLALRAGDTGFFNWNLQSGIVSFDPTETRITGLGKSGQIDPEEFLQCVEADDEERLRAAIESTINGQEDYDERFAFARPDGEQIWLEGTGCVIRDDDGTPLRFIGLNRDVTEQVMREQELDEQAREAEWHSEQKSRFLAQVSHEIRTPLTAMLGCVDAMLESVEAEKLRSDIRLLRTQGETLRILVNDFLDLAKIEQGKLKVEKQPVELAKLIGETRSLMEPLAQEKGLALQCKAVAPVPTTVVVDPYRLRQVLINLVGNAIKFTQEGNVAIEVEVVTDKDQRFLITKVSDTGPGIPQEKLGVLFEEYERVLQTDVGGSGLGLAISKRLTELMDGTIEVESELGLGSTFTVVTPLEDYECEWATLNLELRPSTVEGDANVKRPQFALKVLAAEDTRAIQHVLRRLLGKMVESSMIVQDGNEAVTAIRDAAQTNEPFDVILMDIQMPNMDGTTATSLLRDEGYDLPIIALTAGAMESERAACMAAGCTHFLSKPIDVESLREILQEIYESRAQ